MRRFNAFPFGLGLALCLLCMTHCKTISVRDLQPGQPLATPLPRLAPVFYAYPVPMAPPAMRIISFSGPDSAIRQPILLPPVLDSAENRGIRSSYYQNRNASELEVYFARDVVENLSSSGGQVRGYASCVVTAMEQRNNDFGFFAWHFFTLGTTALLGVPTGKADMELEVEVQIKNLKQEVIGTYRAVGRKKLVNGLYYGYQWGQNRRAAILFAFKAALADIKKQIRADEARLTTLL